MLISANGEVVPCCQDFLYKEKMGNLFIDSLGKTWNGRKYRAIREKINNDISKIELCGRLCSERDYDRDTSIVVKL